MSTSLIDQLQLRALEERADLHRSASELRQRLDTLKDKLRLTKQAREHMGMACGLTGVVGLLTGYAFAGIFVRR